MLPVQLSEGLRFGESMSRRRVRAVVVTPQAGGASRWMLEDLPEPRWLLVYGTTTARALTVNGRQAAWKSAPGLNRLVIQLPPGAARVELTS
jgi:hypothetical protein